ncbi:peptide chain release factor N(5)-glutamine methyltransferase [Iodobacter ciconiae]|uniref:Release factor glutamine methyltransferase n=1 Tax=Iodobacter ciconiae TaxID=2496266 RepID=A0A3S8ZVT3_9NEIS|nr:peptide chain release factor N(5)-glutamine methyltransferase [Iodobacter ciconiae]AZN37592.1 peptide chain release factor N(5)-glutamine methyltransferase [Iodobacter ciconiae]
MNYSALLLQSGLDKIDAQVLFGHCTGKNRAWLIGHGQDEVDPLHASAFNPLAARRRAGEPVAYIVGTREFFGRDFVVNPSVLIPRPDTELLVELALERAGDGARVLDLGTGSGCIPITLKLERLDLDISAVDLSPAALIVAQTNASQLEAAIRFYQSDWYQVLGEVRFDVIVSNPPYIEQNDHHLSEGDLRFEPRSALSDEGDGLAHIRSIISGACSHLSQHGWLLFEHGWDQSAACRALLEEAGFYEVQSWLDLSGIERVTGGRWAGA